MIDEIKLLSFFRNFCKVFSIAHAVGCLFCALMVDASPHYVRVLLLFLYCLVVSMALFFTHQYLEDKIVEEHDAACKISICKGIKRVINDINRDLIEMNDLR